MSETDHATERDEKAPDPDSDAGPGGETHGDGLARDARTLRVTVESVDDFFNRAGSKLERLERGEGDTLPREKRLSFTTVEQLFSVSLMCSTLSMNRGVAICDGRCRVEFASLSG